MMNNLLIRACFFVMVIAFAAASAAGQSLIVEGRGFVVGDLKDGAPAYGNRRYVWRDVPKRFVGWQFTRTDGGAKSAFTVKAAADGVIHIATATTQDGIELAGWTKFQGVNFRYTDGGRTRMAVFTRPCKAAQAIAIPQGNWCGGIVLAPKLAGKATGPGEQMERFKPKPRPAPKPAGKPDHSTVPGVVIDHMPAYERKYVGSPSIAILPGGSYVASHDIFGPRSSQSVTRVFGSDDKGKTWRRQVQLDGQWWSGLFVHRGDLYIMGVSRSYGNVVIRRSKDAGRTWTEPRDADTGVLLTSSRYHTSTVPVIIHNGRIWRAMEDNTGRWGTGFRAFMMSAAVDADLLKASSWTVSNRLGRDGKWLGGKFGGWLEGNAVVTPAGKLVNILRASTASGGTAAVIDVAADGKTVTFDPKTGFIDFPGGCKKFTIRYDEKTKRYYSLTNAVLDRYRGKNRSERTRNVLALTSSPNLKTWTVRSIVLEHADTHNVGFQYVDWHFEGDDLVAASRTAHPDGIGGAHNSHDANYLTFHRIRNFRKLDGGEKKR